MDKSILIGKIARHFGVPDSEQKLFFEIFLRKCSEELDPGEPVKIGEIGKLEYRKARSEQDEDTIAIITNEEDNFVFGIPEEDKEIYSIDSYFSISIGKPVIPLKGNEDSEFFIPHSGNEMKRMFELKVGRFIEDARKSESEVEESALDLTDDVSHINFSFKNWKSSSDLDRDSLEEKIDEQEEMENNISELQDEENQLVKEPDVEEQIEEETVSDSREEISNEILEETETQLEEITPEIIEVPQSVEEITEKTEDEINKDENIEEELKSDLEQSELSEAGLTEDEPSDDLIEEDEKNFESYNEQPHVDEEEYLRADSASLSDEEESVSVDDDKQAVLEAIKYAEEKEERLESYRKRPYGGFIFAVVVLVVIGTVIYFAYYLTNTNNKTAVQQPETPKEFAVTIERSYDIPVTYPYEKGMFDEAYNAIDEELLSKSMTEETLPGQKLNETISPENEISGNIEIRNPLPTSRIKGYIYKYENMYAVQVSSWKSKSIAISEAQKFLNAGYNAFIEKTELGDKGTYYRVRIGGFNSLEEAEDFLKK